MARLKAWLRSPQSRQKIGAIRLAVLGLMLAAAGIALLFSSHRLPANASTGRLPASPPPQKGCGCRKSDNIAGVRLHYAHTPAGAFRLAQSAGAFRLAQSAGPGDSGADVIIPDDARWDTWVLAPGDERVLATTAPLPAGGQWTALFGTVSDNGDGTVTYVAPADVPPYGLDEIDYSNNPSGPNIQLMVSVRGGGQGQMAARGGHAALHLTGGSTGTSTSDCLQQPTALASLPLLRRVPRNIRGDYARTVRWLKLEQDTAGPSPRLAQATTQDGSGYMLPAWVDNGGTGVYTPALKSNGAQATIPVVCQGPGPVNPYPDYPPGKTTYNCTPRTSYDVHGSWQQNPPAWSGWSTFQTVDTSVDFSLADKIRNAGGSVDANGHVHTNYRSRSVFYTRVMYTDHYRCADSGRNWIYVSTTMCTQNCNGLLFDPSWVRLLRGWPANGDCGNNWTPNPPACHDIHVQPH